MAVTLGVSGLTQSQIQKIVDQVSTQGVQPPSFATEPTGFSNGQTYRNTTDGKLYVKTPTGFEPIETGSDEFATVNW